MIIRATNSMKTILLLLLMALSLCSKGRVSGFNLPRGSTHNKNNNTRMITTTQNVRHKSIFVIYGGGSVDNNDSSSSNQQQPEIRKKARILRYSTYAISTLILVALTIHRDSSLRILQTSVTLLKSLKFPTPNDLRNFMVPILDRLNNAKGQVIYTLCMLLWTMTVGITTPVETAAGMAFGVRKGILCNALGKMGGATASFLLGRHYLNKYVNRKLANNEILHLVEDSIQEKPLVVSMLFRFAPLPEFAKNFGLSILPVKMRWFVLAVLIHGLPYTCLWTCMGAETARVLRGGVPSATLGLILTCVTWFGILVPPPIIGFWIKGLRKKNQKQHPKD
mmetsp:Transcript_14594/g.22513  ORF Transcript_14594/g.22513 Transcript_14594/m.22513 type:complete len:336 (+) Transcript_14594:63-1070(+)